ncbi:hypothetical protein CEXT_192851 [Caerostris extrusa]|uniref:Uncharacterized protein n=1 Tax=Caerostris extrusa TaxID=172846 RepID=A0AAV4XXI5_CAEEX|nr:hypothetical protein CEXT_192851 [Caerostris extrusa]
MVSVPSSVVQTRLSTGMHDFRLFLRVGRASEVPLTEKRAPRRHVAELLFQYALRHSIIYMWYWENLPAPPVLHLWSLFMMTLLQK